ncbi:hypothetical protein BDC45DRAFT_568419 [Circinella umbellata]|nr:hypothetical protein BDC45DRAFT_568419 [Circinella umbellata]
MLMSHKKKLRQSLTKRQKGQVELAQWAKEKWNLRTAPAQSTISEIDLSKKDEFLAMTDEEIDGKRNRRCVRPSIDSTPDKESNDIQAETIGLDNVSHRYYDSKTRRTAEP